MPRQATYLCLIICTLALTGCIKRTITIHSAPEGAVAYLNDEEVGRTPATVQFTWYGKYDVRLEKDGYQTLTTVAEAKAPWYETPGIDLFAEMVPGDHHVDLQWHFDLQPTEPVDEAKLIGHGKQLRALLNQAGQTK